jgi:hypothetical protein
MQQTEEGINMRFVLAIFFKYWHCILLEYGTFGPKYLGNALLLIVIFKSVNLVVKEDGVR